MRIATPGRAGLLAAAFAATCAMAASLAVLHFIAPGAAHAADVADEAQFHFERGNQFYRQGRFDDALASYYASNRLVANRNVQFNIGRCLEQLQRYEEAFRAWAALDASLAPAAERETARAAIDRLRPHLALLRVETTPPGAVIYVGRRDLGSLGETPKLLALREGPATLLIELPGHRPVEVHVEVAKGKEARVAPALERIYGRLDLRRLPPDAVVRRALVDGEVLRRGPGAVQLLPGRHVLFVSAPGHQVARLETEVVADVTTQVDVPLPAAPPAVGAIVVRASAEGALVRVDGKELGFSPTVLENVPIGRRRVEISHDGRRTHRQEVVVAQGDRVYLDVRLGRADPEVTAATKELVQAEEAPASITVIGADEIAAFGWTTVAEALAGVGGVFASDDRAYQSVGFRGFSPPGDYTNRVLVLVDGHPTNDVLTGQGFVGHDLDVDLAQVERIEVVRGPGSVLYGTGALFGVINVVTRAPARAVEAEARSHFGTLGTTSGRATVGGRAGGLEVVATAAALDQIGDRRFMFDPTGSASAERADGQRAYHVDLSARLGRLSLRASANERKKAVPTGAFETEPGAGTTYEDVRLFFEMRGERQLGNVRLSARAAYDASRFRGRYLLTPDPLGTPRGALADEFRAQWLTGELRLALPAGRSQRFIVGGEAQRQFEIDLGGASRQAQREARAERELVLSGYIVDDWEVARGLRLNAGLRADRYGRNFGTTLNPRLALIARPYAAGNTKIFVGRAFRAPSPYERFYNDGGVTQRRADALEPELVVSADVEHTHRVDEDVTLTGTAFANEVSDLIVLGGRAAAADGVLAYRNHPFKVRGFGAGAELRWEPGGGTHVVLAYAWQRVRSQTEDRSLPFPNAPRHSGALRAISPLVVGKLRLANELLVDTGRHTRFGRRVDDAVTWNAVLSGEHRPWRLRYYGGLYNLLDVRGHGAGFPVGDEVPAATVPRYGRSVRVGLSISL